MGDFDKIWREHCEDEQTLSEYALAMKNLADSHWTKKCEGEGRIEWCRRCDASPGIRRSMFVVSLRLRFDLCVDSPPAVSVKSISWMAG